MCVTSRMPVRLLIVVLLIAGAARAQGQELLRIAELAEGGELLEEVLSALLRDADAVAADAPSPRSQADAIATAGSAIFTSPLTTGNPDQLGIVRHWGDDFLRRLDQLDDERRGAVIDALGRLIDDATTPAEAMRLLPAPEAVAILSAAADRAFDRGRLHAYLAIATELDASAPGWERAGDRRTVARRLLALAPQGGDPVALHEPGPLLPASAPPTTIDLDAGIGVTWVIEDGHLLACDPWLQVRWQRPLEPRAQVDHGAGAVAIRTERSLLVLDERGDGTERPISPSVRLLGIRDGAAWLAVGRQHHALRPDGGRRDPITLSDEALDAPLVQGRRSLWLTTTTLELIDGDETIMRLHHGLPRGAWRLRMSRHGPVITDPERAWMVGSPREDQHPARRWAEHLVRAGRADVLLAEPGPADPDLLALAYLVAGEPAPAELSPSDPSLALQLALARNGGLAAAAGTPAVRAAVGDRDLRTPLLIPGPDDDPRNHPDHWGLVIASAALVDDEPPLGLAAGPEAPDPGGEARASRERDPVLGPIISEDGLRLRIRQDDRWIVAAVYGPDGLRWRQRFAAAGFFLPTVGIAAVGDAVLVAEGQSRVRVFDRRLGTPWGRLRKPVDLPLRDLVPLGGDAACYIDGEGALIRIDGERSRPWPLPAAARWAVPVADGAVVATDDGAVVLPGGDAIAWPRDLVAGARPLATRAGLWRGGTLWPWLR